MKIGILGSGMVGQTLAAKLAERGGDVMVSARERGEGGRVGGGRGREGRLPQRDGRHGEIVFNATKGEASVDALRAAGEANLAGKVLIDIANPLDFSTRNAADPVVSNTDSLGEQIQRAFPETKVVKTLNTVNAGLMVNPGGFAGGDHTIFVSGNDAAAKAEVSRLLAEWFGWRDIIDLGDITTARGTESLLPVWVRLMMAFGHANFQFKIVR